MRIYFYDGNLANISSDAMPSNEVHWINAALGPTHCRKMLDLYKELNTKYIITNSLIALSHVYGWNEEENHTDIYLWVDKLSKYVRIDGLTRREIRRAHNIEKMYLAGVFDETDLQKETEA